MELKLITALYSACIGGCIASFFNLIACRLPKEESIVKPGSHCTNCNHKLKAYENIPIVSYLILRGKCSKCNSKIGIVDFLIELGTFIFYFIVFYFEPNIINAISYCIAFSTLLLISYIDCLKLEVYIIMPIAAIATILSLRTFEAIKLNQFKTLEYDIISMLILVITLYILGNIFYKGKLGDGDVYIYSVVASITPWYLLSYSVLVSCISGMVYIFYLRFIKKIGLDKPIAFAPHISVGFLVTSLSYILIK